MAGLENFARPSQRDAHRALGLAALSLYAILAGCSAKPPASASISQSKTLTLYEGLPHQFNEPHALLAEKKAKPTVERDGFTFYSETLDLSARDAGELKALLANPHSFEPFSGEKKCGGFHPDYAVEWSVADKLYRCLLCFGCYEARIHGPLGVTTYDIESATFKQLKQMLTPYRKNRPAISHEM
jgi:hypothetical protein